MQEVQPDWYKKIWTLDIKNMSWVEETEKQVDFLIREMSLRGNEKILDLACGFGRHCLAFAKRGFPVLGVDITPSYIEDAKKTAREKGLQAEFLCADIRDIRFSEEFDVVLNLADGAIGYLEDEGENVKIFDAVANALKPGGKHFMDICSRAHAEAYFPKKHWEIGEKAISLATFSWDKENKRMLYGGAEIPFETPLSPFREVDMGSSIRLYNKEEIGEILSRRGMQVVKTFSDYSGTPDGAKHLQLMVYSRKL